MTDNHIESVEIITLGCTEVVIPLPPRLTPQQAIREARELEEWSFTTEAGRAQYRDLTRRGYHLLSWPDGTRAAVRKPDGQHLTRLAGAVVYRGARDEIERRLLGVLRHQGEA